MLALPAVAVAKPDKDVSVALPSWTYAIYMDGDNNLEMYWDGYSLPMLQAVAPSADVNIVAMVDLQSTTGTEIVKISGSTVTVVETAPEMNMGDPATLTWWITKASTLFPSTNLALSLWDHGYGWIYVCKDDTSGGESLSMPELQAAIEGAGKRIDVIAFDCCNMANVEVAYQLSLTNLVSYMVGSEETVPADGFPYDLMLGSLVSYPAMTPQEFSVAMVDGWAGYYYDEYWANTVNLAAIDVAQVGATIGTFTQWSADMITLLPDYEKQYESALKNSYTMWATHYFPDLYDYGSTLVTTKGVTDATLITDTAVMQGAVGSYCIAVWDGSHMTECVGISLYWGTGFDWKDRGTAYLELAFAQETGWGEFLTAYNA